MTHAIVFSGPIGVGKTTLGRAVAAQLGVAGHGVTFVSLWASAASVVAAGRGRAFSADEERCIAEMIAQRYGSRPFSDLVVDTDKTGFEATTELLVAAAAAACLNAKGADPYGSAPQFQSPARSGGRGLTSRPFVTGIS